jgi:hypothetical protein
LEIVSGKREGEKSSIPLDDENEKDQNEETELLEEAGGCITRLFRVSSLIRQAAPKDLFAKALSRNRYQFNDQFDIAHVGEKYPKLAVKEFVWLQRRLGQAITQRRHYLSYIQDHREKLESKSMLHHEETTELVEPDPQALTKQLSAIDLQPDSSSRPSTFFTKASSLAPDLITPQMLNAEEESDTENDARSYTTISRSVDGDLDSSTTIRIPKLEELRTGSKREVECPFCFRMKKFKNERVWRKHVFSDLRSYICTLPNCNAAYFGDINQWFRHEMQTHRVSYTCQFCKSKTYHLKEYYLDHVRKKHPAVLGDGDEQTVLDMARKPLEQISAQECPFCSDWVDRLKERTVVANMNSDASEQIIYVDPTVFKRHLASHLEQLALFAIPIGSAEENADSNAAIEEDQDAASIVSKFSTLGFMSSRQPSLANKDQSSDENSIVEEILKFADNDDNIITSGLDKGVVAPLDHTLEMIVKEFADTADQLDSPPYPAFLRDFTLVNKNWDTLEWDQFQRLRDTLSDSAVDQPHPWARCSGDEYATRNRYANVDPYQAHRIHLDVPNSYSDYINASPITLVSTRSRTPLRYIATQGPKADSWAHIWRMLWHENVSPAVIVMLTRTHEAGRQKCYPYYPQSLESPDMPVNEHDEFQDNFVHTLHLATLAHDEDACTEVREIEMKSANRARSGTCSLQPGLTSLCQSTLIGLPCLNLWTFPVKKTPKTLPIRVSFTAVLALDAPALLSPLTGLCRNCKRAL